MFRAARWRSEKNRIKAVFKLQFKATQVPPTGWESMTVTLVPVDVGKPSMTSEKAAIIDGECQWLNPIYETVKFTQDPKKGKINDKVYQFVVSAPGFVKSRVFGETNINFTDYVEVFKPTSVSLFLQGSNNGAILHVTIQRAQDDGDGRKMVENGDIMKETIENRGETTKPLQRMLQSQLSKPENEGAESASNRESDIISAKEGSFMKLYSNKYMPLCDDSSAVLRKSSSFDGISASGSESSSGQYTPKENGIKKKNNAHQENASSLSLFSTNDTPQNTDWIASSNLDANNAGSTNSSGSENTLKKQKSDLDTLTKQLIVSDLELQTLRKQVVKERRRGQDLSKEISSLIEERDAIRKECDELKVSKKRADHVENISAMLQLEVKDPWSILEKMKDELDHEKNLNATLRLQLQKTQDSNSELIFAVRDLEEMLKQKNREMSCIHKDSREMEYQNQLSHLRNSENKQESFETASDHEDEQCRLDVLMNEQVVRSQEKQIRYLNSELELYKKDHEHLEMQIEQIALDYEILKQENHYISSRLEQIQLREQLRMQCECPSHTAIINDLESHVDSLEKELGKKAEAYEDNLATIIHDKVEQEQRAIQAEEELRKTKWKNANTVEQLQNEFKRLSSQLSTTFYASEELVMKTLKESRELRLENCHLRALLDKNTKELSSVQSQHQVKCRQLLSLIDFKTKEVDRLQLELKDKREELDHHKKSEEATQNASMEEMTILRAETDQLASKKSHLTGQIEQKEKLLADVERLNASTKEIERLLQESNLEKDQLGKEIFVLKEEAQRTLVELNSLRHLKDEQDETIKALNSKETITTQYTNLKHSLSDDELEKESLRKQVCLLRGDRRKKADIIANMEKRFKDNNAKLTISEGTKMGNIRNKSKRTSQASHGIKMVASLQGNSKPSYAYHINAINENMHEDQQKTHYEFGVFGPLNVARSQDHSDATKNLKNYNTNSVEINEAHLQEKLIQDKELMDSSYDSYGERIRRNLQAYRKTEGKSLVSFTDDQQKVSEVTSEVAELKKRNESMKAQLKKGKKDIWR